MSDGTRSVTVSSQWAVLAAQRADTNGQTFLTELSNHVYDELVRHLKEAGKKPVTGVQIAYLGHVGGLDYAWMLTEAGNGKRKPRAWLASRKSGCLPLATESYNFQAIKIP